MHTLAGADDGALCINQGRGDRRDRARVGAAFELRGFLVVDRAGDLFTQEVRRKLDQHRRRPPILDLGEGTAQRLLGGARHSYLLAPFGDVAEVERGVEVRTDLVDVAGIAGRQYDDRTGIAPRLRHTAKGVLGTRTVLHRKDADAVARGDLGDRVAHVQPDPLL